MKLSTSIIICLIVIACSPRAANAQAFIIDTSSNYIDAVGNFNGAEIHINSVKKTPEFEGGKQAWQDFLRRNINIKVPFSNRAAPGRYMVMIGFIIGSDGTLKNIAADSNCGYGMETELIRCIRLSPAWIPAETSSGIKVSYTLHTMVYFTVKQNDVMISFQ